MKSESIFPTLHSNEAPHRDDDIGLKNIEMKAILYWIKGGTSTMVIEIPKASNAADPFEICYLYLKQYILDISRFWIDIVAFQISTPYGSWYPKEDIPVGQVFMPNREGGRWSEPPIHCMPLR